MTNDPASGNAPALPAKTVGDCQHDAVILAGMLEGLDLMLHEVAGMNGTWGNAIISVAVAAMERASLLADDLDRLSTQRREAQS